MKVSEVGLNPEYLIAKRRQDAHYSDVFQVQTQCFSKPPKPKDCMVAFFNSFSPLLIKLIISREAMARSLGLKTADKLTQMERDRYFDEFQGNVGDSIAIFDVLAKNSNELLTGQSDKHLDFELSFISYRKANTTTLELVTVVKFHNIFGRAYFFFVKPIHRFYMKRILRKMTQVLLYNSN